jgi:hypothetical protein
MRKTCFVSLLVCLSGCQFVASPAPVAVAGPNQQVPVFTTVTLDGSASYDPDGEPLVSYHWTQTFGTSVTIQNADPPVAPFQANSTGGFIFQLTVQDASGNTATATTDVDVF